MVRDNELIKILRCASESRFEATPRTWPRRATPRLATPQPDNFGAAMKLKVSPGSGKGDQPGSMAGGAQWLGQRPGGGG